MNRAIAYVTVLLPRALTGAEVIAAVEAVATDTEGHRFESHQFYFDGDARRVGRASGYPDEQLLVADPDTDQDVLYVDKTYSKVVVKNWSWGGSQYLVPYDNRDVITAVQGFANALTAHLNGA